MKQYEKHTDTNNESFIKAFFSNGKKLIKLKVQQEEVG